jgi:hypothetical protein
MEDVGIFYGHLVHFSRFGMFALRKIWQPCCTIGTDCISRHLNIHILSNVHTYLTVTVDTITKMNYMVLRVLVTLTLKQGPEVSC